MLVILCCYIRDCQQIIKGVLVKEMLMENNEQPNYVLSFNEGVLVPKKNKYSFMKKAVIAIIVILVIGSIIFQDNLFLELDWTTRILLIGIALSVLFTGGSQRVSSPMEIQFYNDYLILYREKRYYSKKVTRKMFDKFYYKDISQCQYKTTSKRINIFGTVEGIWFNYNKDGSLPDKPTYHRTTVGGIDYFYTSQEPNIDFVKEIEAHSPIKVIVEDI
jgi:hypothetical protein